MKTCHEMADSIFERRNEYERARRQRRKTITKTVSAASGVLLAALAGTAAWRTGVFGNAVSGGHAGNPPAVSVTQTKTVASKGEPVNVIHFNHLDRIPGARADIALFTDDFVPMNREEICRYYGTDIFPQVPADTPIWDSPNDTPYGIYKRDGGRGEIYHDVNVLNYSNPDVTRTINLEVAKGKLPFTDVVFNAQTIKASTISGENVLIGETASGYLYAEFLHKSTGFRLTASGLSHEEFVGVLESLLA